jgi:hypothetical protein
MAVFVLSCSVHRTRWGLDPGAVAVTLDVQLFKGMRPARCGQDIKNAFCSTLHQFRLSKESDLVCLSRPARNKQKWETVCDKR